MHIEYFFSLVVSLYQTLTSIPGGGVVLFGGRTSPLNPTGSIVWVTFDLGDQKSAVQLSFKNMNCTGTGPKPRWRHSSTLVCHNGEFIYFFFAIFH